MWELFVFCTVDTNKSNCTILRNNLNLETVCIAEYKTSMYINIYPFTSDGEQIDDRGQTLTLAQDKTLISANPC
jgi:hypothetical protein